MDPVAGFLDLAPGVLWVLLLALSVFVLALGVVASLASLVIRRRAGEGAKPGRKVKPRRSWLVGGLVADAVLLIIAAVALATAPTRSIPVPPRNATAQEVVAAYLDASNAHDVSTMDALVDPSRMPRHSRFDATWSVDQVDMFPEVPDHALDSVLPSGTEVVRVPVDMYLVHGGDASMTNGHLSWGYVLARADDHTPWRIIDQGV